MAIGEITELVNAQNLKLELISSTASVTLGRYVMLQDLDFHLGRPEAREPTTDGGIIYYFGKGDHYFDATLLLTTPEIISFNALTVLDSNGNLPSNVINIIAEPRGGGSDVTIQVTAELPDFNISKPVEGGVIFRVRFRITTDTVSVT
ncbi:hypothetical protein LCGC14_2602400 [marine sediment metagenome]|uniref:Uncharacterized protein n=1 Tax=marine sediment metagenome TaxID=412755 RepID=A0A0F9D137_9ZZZZ